MMLDDVIREDDQDEFLEESKEYLGLEQEQALDLKAYVESKWGFLKNIINIKTFFQGPASAGEATHKAASGREKAKEGA